MTLAAEFCWLCERTDGMVLMAIGPDTPKGLWTRDHEMAVRVTAEGRVGLLSAIKNAWLNGEADALGFRKILVG